MNTISFCRTFAYYTVRDRIPKILAKLVDTCHKHVKVVEENHGKVRLIYCLQKCFTVVATW